MKGYKVFNPDWTCREFQYEVGKTYRFDDEIEPCKSGFHFCKRLADCFNYYSFDPKNKVAEIEATGKVIDGGDGKSVTDKITIVGELTWHEVLDLTNTGADNTGSRNTGDWNTGSCNTGNCNTGDWNTGNWNTGNWNTGDCNTGDCNTGSRNTGSRNTGGCNTGSWNTGDWNTGDWNTGSCNTGNCNTGDWNTGSCNTGNCNTGDWNTGCFNTITPNFTFFNRPTTWASYDWQISAQKVILDRMPVPCRWILFETMTEAEKAEHPEAEMAGGYLRNADAEELKAGRQRWWDKLPKADKETVMELPNFDAKIFEECTLINVKGDKA